MLQVTFFIGLNDKDTKKQEITTIDAFKIVENIFNTYTDGATIRECRGIYKHENGEHVIENTLECFTFEINDEKIVEIVTILKKLLNQESILVRKENVNTNFM